MADLTISSNMDFDTRSLMRCIKYHDDDLKAGEALTKGMPCYIKSDGLVYKAVSTVLTATNCTAFHGFAYTDYAVGARVTLVGPGAKMTEYTAAAGLTPGANYYVSDTAGKVSDAALVSHDPPIAFAVTDTALQVIEHNGGNLS